MLLELIWVVTLPITTRGRKTNTNSFKVSTNNLWVISMQAITTKSSRMHRSSSNLILNRTYINHLNIHSHRIRGLRYLSSRCNNSILKDRRCPRDITRIVQTFWVLWMKLPSKGTGITRGTSWEGNLQNRIISRGIKMSRNWPWETKPNWILMPKTIVNYNLEMLMSSSTLIRCKMIFRTR